MDEIRRALSVSLEARRGEIEDLFHIRVLAISDTHTVHDVEYIEGLRSSISKAFDFGLAGIAGSKGSTPTIPPVLLIQARLAARNGIGLAVVQRRYLDCYHLLDEFVSEEAEKYGQPATGTLGYIRKTTRGLFEMLLDAVEDEYAREHARPSSPEKRRVEIIKECLAGKLVDTSELGYEFSYFHVALITQGIAAEGAIRDFASTLNCLPLIVHLGEGAIWAWLGNRERPDPDYLSHLLASQWPPKAPLGIGEVCKGHEGWRRSHRQAGDAFRLANHVPSKVSRYGDDPLLASICRDDVLVSWLRETYLAPLETERDGGARLRETLRTYFAADRNGPQPPPR